MTLTLRQHLSVVLGRTVGRDEIADALGVSLSTYKRRAAQPSAEDVLHVSRALGVPPMAALLACGHITADEVDELAPSSVRLSEFSELELVIELARRIEHRARTALAACGGDVAAARVESGP